jgi:hypothetical protein
VHGPKSKPEYSVALTKAKAAKVKVERELAIKRLTSSQLYLESPDSEAAKKAEADDTENFFHRELPQAAVCRFVLDKAEAAKEAAAKLDAGSKSCSSHWIRLSKWLTQEELLQRRLAAAVRGGGGGGGGGAIYIYALRK